MFDRDSLTLETLGNGGALEMVQASLQRVLDNIQDPNTVADAKIIAVDGRDYSTKKLVPVEEPMPAALEVSTLTALVDYLKENRDALEFPLMVHVASPTNVRILGPLAGPFVQRPTYLTARAMLPTVVLGNYLDSTNFQIMLRSAFVESEAREAIIKIAGNVADIEALTSVDDGMSQSVTVQTGVTTKAKEKLPNPATLAPFRTFLEVKQPSQRVHFPHGEGSPVRPLGGGRRDLEDQGHGDGGGMAEGPVARPHGPEHHLLGRRAMIPVVAREGLGHHPKERG